MPGSLMLGGRVGEVVSLTVFFYGWRVHDFGNTLSISHVMAQGFGFFFLLLLGSLRAGSEYTTFVSLDKDIQSHQLASCLAWYSYFPH